MKPLPHRYEVQLSGGPNGYATVSTKGMPDLRSAPPLDFDGPGDAWSPEHLVLAAVETCFLFTLRAVAKASRVEFLALDLSSEGTVGPPGRGHAVHRDRAAAAAHDRTGDGPGSRAGGSAQEREESCLVSASLATPVRLEPELVTT
jgi:organic hydroperoxide reductase OsmC/OhrA